jgi:hypothetical protein
MKFLQSVTCLAALLLAPALALANDQQVLDRCIADWGAQSPFKKGAAAERVISPGVKVFGIGKSNPGDEQVTAKPTLILVRPAVNVLGKSTIRLANPKGWYCFRNAVTVAGKINIAAHCDAHIASAREDGTSVMASDDSDKGVAVMGALRVTRFDCPEKKGN